MLSRTPRRPPRRPVSSKGVDWGPVVDIKSAEAWRFQWHEEVLKRHDLCRSDLAIAGVLMHCYRDQRGFAEIGLGSLAKRAGCSRSTASAATKRLRRLGLVAVENEGFRKLDGSREVCKYRLIYESRGVR
jgi:hypothetical protein